MSQYWFRAKRYGWGWGLPLCWQGWAVLASHLAAIILLGELARGRIDINLYRALLVGVVLSLIGFCIWKGEPLTRAGGRRRS